jgi:hypothetical protein
VLGLQDSKEYPSSDATWRERLVANLELLVNQLWQVGVQDVFVDGSFAEDKDHPNDTVGPRGTSFWWTADIAAFG